MVLWIKKKEKMVKISLNCKHICIVYSTTVPADSRSEYVNVNQYISMVEGIYWE